MRVEVGFKSLRSSAIPLLLPFRTCLLRTLRDHRLCDVEGLDCILRRAKVKDKREMYIANPTYMPQLFIELDH
jgi:hypothetical protein